MKKVKKETSKKLLMFNGFIFIFSIIFTAVFFVLSSFLLKSKIGAYDAAALIGLVSSTGTVFSINVKFYTRKARIENCSKGQKDLIRYKIKIYEKLNLLSEDYVKKDIIKSIADMENSIKRRCGRECENISDE